MAVSILRPSCTALPLGVGLVALVVLTGSSETGHAQRDSPVLRRDTIARVARTRTSSVVFLHVLGRDAPASRPQLGPSPVREGLGSGVVVDSSGSILTNAHVIKGAESIHVLTLDGDDSAAIVIGIDQALDLALLRAPGLAGLAAAPLGDSDRLKVGDWVVAIGSPFGLHHTVTAGIISAKARGIDHSGIEYLQTDAAINPGSSGGALLDLNGSLVGITTAILAPAGDNIGLNFAIPINSVKEVLPKLHTGTVTHGWVGITTWTLSRSAARALGIDAGVVVVAVDDNSPAADAGIRPGDVLLAISGPSPVAAVDIERRIRDMAPGTSILISLLRDQQRVEVEVMVGTRPPVR